VPRYVHLGSRAHAVCFALFQKRPFLSFVGHARTQSGAALRFTAVIRVTAWKRLVCVSRQAKEVENSQLLRCKAFLFKEPMNQSPSATPGALVAEPRMHGCSFFLGSQNFGHTHASRILFLPSKS
jgi:hypothetical protein